MAQRKNERTSRQLWSRSLLILGFAGIVVWYGHSWHSRAFEVELVHQVHNGDSLLPADIEISVWEGDLLHGSASFFNLDSLDELSHTVVIPKGDYRIVYSVVREFGDTHVRFERALTVDEAGRYYLRYDLEDE